MDTQHLPCKLTDRELLERGSSLAELMRQFAALDDERKRANSEYKARLEGLQGEIESIGRQVRERAEYRPVEVREDLDYSRQVAETVRIDTEEVVSTRPLRPDEKQARLFSVANEENTQRR